MNVINVLLIVIGILIFVISLVSGGLLFYIPLLGYIGWFVGLILVAVGLWRNEKEKKVK
jgi:hypothetical protein